MQVERIPIPPTLLSPGACLADLDEAALADIRSAAHPRDYKKGEIICLEGEACPGLLMIASGWVRGSRTSPQGREQAIRLAGPGEMINDISVMSDISLLSGGRNLVTLMALEASTLWIIRQADVLKLIDHQPALSQMLLKNLAKESANLLNLIEDLALRPVNARLAHLILDHAQGDTLARQTWYTEAEIASSIGTTSEIVSRVLNEMKVQGSISLERHKLIIRDRAQLERILFQKNKS